MRVWFERCNVFLERPLGLAPRVLLLSAAVLLVASFLLPLWNLTVFAPQFPQGLRLDIYSYTLVGGNGGRDLADLNELNRYIGMRDIASGDFGEFKWMPLVIGALGLVFLRAAVHGKMASLIDALVMYLYFGIFALGSFAYKLYWYGHNLEPAALVRVTPFMPPVVGTSRLANFQVYSYPDLGSYVLILVALLLSFTLAFGWREGRLAQLDVRKRR